MGDYSATGSKYWIVLEIILVYCYTIFGVSLESYLMPKHVKSSVDPVTPFWIQMSTDWVSAKDNENTKV